MQCASRLDPVTIREDVPSVWGELSPRDSNQEAATNYCGPPSCTHVEAGGAGGADNGQAHKAIQAVGCSGTETSCLLSQV